MATPFATASDLANRLKVPLWTGADLAQVNEHLADASNDLRAEIGWQVYPPVAITVSAYPDDSGHLSLPGTPFVSVTSVVDADGVTLAVNDTYSIDHGVVHLSFYGRVTVTYTVGYAAPPPDLLKWTCVIAAQSLARAADESLGATPSSEALADYRISYSEQQQLGDLPVPVRVLERLRSAYGQAVYST